MTQEISQKASVVDYSISFLNSWNLLTRWETTFLQSVSKFEVEIVPKENDQESRRLLYASSVPGQGDFLISVVGTDVSLDLTYINLLSKLKSSGNYHWRFYVTYSSGRRRQVFKGSFKFLE